MSWSRTCDVRSSNRKCRWRKRKRRKSKFKRKQIFGLKYMNELNIYMLNTLPTKNQERSLFAHIRHAPNFGRRVSYGKCIQSIWERVEFHYNMCLSHASINRKRLISHSAWRRHSATLLLCNLFCTTESSETTTRPIYLLHVGIWCARVLYSSHQLSYIQNHLLRAYVVTPLIQNHLYDFVF